MSETRNAATVSFPAKPGRLYIQELKLGEQNDALHKVVNGVAADRPSPLIQPVRFAKVSQACYGRVHGAVRRSRH